MADPAKGTPTAGVYTDPFRAFNFKMEVQGVTEGHFTEISGLGAGHSISYREAATAVVHTCRAGSTARSRCVTV